MKVLSIYFILRRKDGQLVYNVCGSLKFTPFWSPIPPRQMYLYVTKHNNVKKHNT